MSSTDNFYEVLGVDADSPPEDIRRAYKKKALRTHPDRLPQGATAIETQAANDRFRAVNNAYEILMDSNKRKLYDFYGVWPPPEEFPEEPGKQRGNRSDYPPNRPHPQSAPFDDYFFNSPPFADPFARHRPRPTFVFRDPFELFNIMFADLEREHRRTTASLSPFDFIDPHFPSNPLNPNSMSNPFNRSMFHPSPFFQTSTPFPGANFAGDDDDFLWGGPSRPNNTQSRPNSMQGYSFQNSSQQYISTPNGQQPQWVSESTMVRTINGVTEKVCTRRDSSGNQHVTRIHPDGSETYTVNGVEQRRSPGHIQTIPGNERLRSANLNYDSTPPIIPPEPQSSSSSSKRRWGWGRS